VRPESTARREAPRRRREAAAPFPHDGQRVGSPHAPAPWLFSPAGRISPPPPLATGIAGSRVGGKDPPGGWGRPSLRRLRAPCARIGVGVSVTRSFVDTEGSPAPNALPGRSRRSLGAPRVGGEQAPSGRPPAGQNRTSTEWEEKKSRPRHWQEEKLHAVRNKGECAARGNEAEDAGQGRLSG